jgi:tRNA nucleotidyltransferase/poly(A) polymerase
VGIIKNYTKFLEALKNVNDMWDVIPQSVKDLHDLFSEQGKKLYLVGGSVRDFLTGDKPKDFDLATDALPDEVLEIIGSKYRTNLQGKAFGVVVVYTKDQPEGMEIATFREDVSKGRNPEVKLGVTIDQDVKRRDLTYNALFYDLDKRDIVDLTGGREDLEKGITRMVGDAGERFDEDSLRILRAFRFASRYNHPLDKETYNSIVDRKVEYPDTRLQNLSPETGKMERISQERVWEEFKKAFKQAKDFNYYLQFFTDFDMWDEVFPNSNVNTDLVNCDDFIVVLANLFQGEDTSKLERKMVQDWKIEIDVARPVIFLIDFMKLTPENAPDLFKQKMRCHIKDETIREWIQVKNLKDPIFEVFLKYKPSVSAEELMVKGLKGKALGDTIKQMEIENFKKLI